MRCVLAYKTRSNLHFEDERDRRVGLGGPKPQGIDVVRDLDDSDYIFNVPKVKAEGQQPVPRVWRGQRRHDLPLRGASQS